MRILKSILCFALFAFVIEPVLAFRSVSRYIPFIDRPNPYKINNFSNLTMTVFWGNAFRAYKDGDDNRGIPEVWGRYNLKSIIASVKAVRGPSFINPLLSTNSIVGLADKDIFYNVNQRIKTGGMTLEYEQNLYLNYVTFGAWIPLFHVTSYQTFEFDRSASDEIAKHLPQPSVDELDKIRRFIQKDLLDLDVGEWNKGGFGDLDLYFRFHFDWEYVLAMKKINLNVQVGTLFPTGRRRTLNNPASIPFMTNGNYGLYLDVVPEFELKDDLKVGFMLGVIGQSKVTKKMRIPVTDEPFMFSALIGTAKVKPGLTTKASVYFSMENLFDGLNFQLRYTHLKHYKDRMVDKRPLPQRVQVLSNPSSYNQHSKWTADYFTLDFSYDSTEAFHHWKFAPYFYLSYDYPVQWFGAKGAAKNHEFTVGAKLHF